MKSGSQFAAALGAATLAAFLFARDPSPASPPPKPLPPKPQAKTQPAVAILDALPGDTTLVARVRSCSDLERKFKASPFYGLRHHPGLIRFIDEMKKKVDEGLADIRTKVGFNPTELLGLIEGELVFAVGGLDKIAAAIAAEFSGGDGDARPGDIPVVLIANAGGSAPKLREKLAKVFEYAQKEGARKEVEDFRGGKITTLSQAKEKAKKDDLDKVFFGDVGSLVLASINRPFLEQTMAGLTSPAPDALTRSADFATTQREVKGESDVLFFLNIRPIAAAARKHLQASPQASMVWNMVEGKVLGRSLKNVGASMSLREGDIEQLVFVNNGGASDGIMGVFKGPTFPGRPSSIVPADVDSYFSISLNMPYLYGLIKDVAAMMMAMFQGGAGPGGPGQMPDPETMVEAMYGVKLRQVIDALGSTLHFYQRGAGGLEGVGNFTVALELKDEMPVRDLFQKLGMAMGLQAQKYLDRDYYPLPAGGPGGGDGPAVGLADKLAVFGVKGDSVKELMRRAGKGGKGLADSPEIQPLLKLVPPQVTTFSYSSAKSVRDSLAAVKQALAANPEAFPVPDLTALGDVFGGGIGYGHWKEQGLFCAGVTLLKKGSSAPTAEKKN